MIKDKREGWLAKLQVGSPVIISNIYNEHIGKVRNITPSGKIDILGTRYNECGRIPGQGGFGSLSLEEATPERVAALKKKDRVARIRSILDNINRTGGGLLVRNQLTQTLDDTKVKDFYDYLVEWEKEHGPKET